MRTVRSESSWARYVAAIQAEVKLRTRRPGKVPAASTRRPVAGRTNGICPRAWRQPTGFGAPRGAAVCNQSPSGVAILQEAVIHAVPIDEPARNCPLGVGSVPCQGPEPAPCTSKVTYSPRAVRKKPWNTRALITNIGNCFPPTVRVCGAEGDSPGPSPACRPHRRVGVMRQGERRCRAADR